MRQIFAGMVCLLLVFCFLAGVPPCAHAHQGEDAKKLFTKHFKGTLFDITEKAYFSIEILLDDKEYKIGKDVIGIVVHNAHDEDVAGAEIAIELINLDTGKSINQSAVVRDKGDGLYTVENLDLAKEGRQKLTLKIKKDSVEDSVQFTLPDAMKNLLPAGKYSP
jgi:hypothetical protein